MTCDGLESHQGGVAIIIIIPSLVMLQKSGLSFGGAGRLACVQTLQSSYLDRDPLQTECIEL